MESPALQTRADLGNDRTVRAHWAKWRFRIFTSAWVLYAAYYFCRKNFSVIMPMMARSRHYGNFDLAQLVFVFSLAYATGQFVAGALGDRFGGRLTGMLGGLISAACNAGMAVATNDYRVLLLLQIGNGLGQGCGWSACLKVLGAWFARKERGTVMAWWGTCYVLGGFLATVFATFAATQMFVANSMGWRRGFLFPAIILGAAALWFGLRTRNAPPDAGLPAHREDGGDSGRPRFVLGSSAQPRSLDSLRHVLLPEDHALFAPLLAAALPGAAHAVQRCLGRLHVFSVRIGRVFRER